MLKKAGEHRHTALFDIRIKNLDHDVLVLKGAPDVAGQALLAGEVVLSVNEPIIAKKLNMRLYSILRINPDHLDEKTGPRPLRFEKVLFSHTWENQSMEKHLVMPKEVSPRVSPNASSTSLKSLGESIRSKSASNLSSMGSAMTARGPVPNTLDIGNYEFPFSTVVPGNIPESVEGLPGCSVVYVIEATLERGKFYSDITTRKRLRVVRTFSTDAAELTETVAVDNTWPQKVEYSLSVPSKVIATGSVIPISFTLVPLLKGIRFGRVKVQFLELYMYVGYVPPPYSAERSIVSKSIPNTQLDPEFTSDNWEFDTTLELPSSLSKCTQDCSIESFIRVRHKLKFVIELINPDGHISELRAALPIQLFISPFVSVRANNEVFRGSNSGDAEVSGDEAEGEEYLFSNGVGGFAPSPKVQNSHPSSYNSSSGLVAPPVYQNHIYDRLWSDVSGLSTPTQSGASTPRNDSNSDLSNGGNGTFDSSQLAENLLQLRMREEPARGAYAPVPKSHGNESSKGKKSSKHSKHSDIVPPRPGSVPADLPQNTPHSYMTRAKTDYPLYSNLLQLPSYSQAVRSNADLTALSPAYEPPLPGSQISKAGMEDSSSSKLSQSASHVKNILPTRPHPVLMRGVSLSNLENGPSNFVKNMNRAILSKSPAKKISSTSRNSSNENSPGVSSNGGSSSSSSMNMSNILKKNR